MRSNHGIAVGITDLGSTDQRSDAATDYTRADAIANSKADSRSDGRADAEADASANVVPHDGLMRLR
jgi:hypothetical protein